MPRAILALGIWLQNTVEKSNTQKELKYTVRSVKLTKYTKLYRNTEPCALTKVPISSFLPEFWWINNSSLSRKLKKKRKKGHSQ